MSLSLIKECGKSNFNNGTGQNISPTFDQFPSILILRDIYIWLVADGVADLGIVGEMKWSKRIKAKCYQELGSSPNAELSIRPAPKVKNNAGVSYFEGNKNRYSLS